MSANGHPSEIAEHHQTIFEILNSVLLRQQKLEQAMEYQSNKIDELLHRQFASDKVLQRL